MLIQFSVANFLSINDKVTLDLTATSLTERENDNVVIVDKLRLLKGVAIYGANASGKSNILTALRFVDNFVSTSTKGNDEDEIPVEGFRLNKENNRTPSFFEMIFLTNDTRYRYGFEITNKIIISEWLYSLPIGKRTERLLFIRDKDDIEVTRHFPEGAKVAEQTRSNALLLSVSSQFNGPIAKIIMRWFYRFRSISTTHEITYEDVTSEFLLSKDEDDVFIKKNILELLKAADLQIEDIQVNEYELTSDMLPKEMPEELKKVILSDKNKGKPERNITIIKNIYDDEIKQHRKVRFDLEDDESEGTKRLFRLAGPIIHSLIGGFVLAVDEFDSQLHPLLTRALVRLFNHSDYNKNGAQLIFSTHDTNLLSSGLLRRDQIYFTEKNINGSTDLYSLADYILDDGNKVRKDSSFEADYFKGKYGAVPFIGGLGKLLKK